VSWFGLGPDVGSATDSLWNAVTGRLTSDQVAALQQQEAGDLVRAGMGQADASRTAAADIGGYVETLGGGTSEEYLKNTLAPALFGFGSTGLVVLGLVAFILVKKEL
jgi:hypothetical protein